VIGPDDVATLDDDGNLHIRIALADVQAPLVEVGA
jgi:hypothetical protein